MPPNWVHLICWKRSVLSDPFLNAKSTGALWVPVDDSSEQVRFMIERLLETFCQGLRVLLGVLIAALAIPVGMQVIARYTGIIPVYLWTEELATFIFVWAIMIGATIAVWEQTHFDVRVIPDAKRPILRLLQDGFVLVMITAFAILFAVYGIEYAQFGSIQNSPMMRANMLITHVSVPIAGALWTLFAGYRLFQAFATYQTTSKELS